MPEVGIKSILGYSRNSPYKNDPFIDIFTPGGLIDMSNTDKDLMGVDEYGNKKKMKAGRKNPYKFEGQMVREVPMQKGGKPPIYTTNPNDPRIRNYQDSLLLSDNTKWDNQYVKNNENYEKSYLRLRDLNKEDPKLLGNRGDEAHTPIYTVPKQPVIYNNSKSPIYTNNPQDPRLKSYNDSLELYNNYIADFKDYTNPDVSSAFGTRLLRARDPQVDPTELKALKERAEKVYGKEIKPVDYMPFISNRGLGNDRTNYPAWTSRNNSVIVENVDQSEIDYLPIYQKPVQSVLYKKPDTPKLSDRYNRPSLNHQNIPIEHNNVNNLGAPQQVNPALNLAGDQVTPFSFTYPSGGYNNQKSIYAPDKESLKKFLKDRSTISTQEGSDYMTSAGYLKLGGIRPYQAGGSMNNLFSYLFDDDEDNQPKQDVPTAPSTDELDEREAQLTRREHALQSQQQDDLAMQIANEEFSQGNPYARQMRRGSEQRQFDDEGNPLEAPMGVNPYVLQTQNDLMSQFNLGSKGIWGDSSHQQRVSDHNTGDAEDFSFDNPTTATASINKLMNEAKERNVKYIIYNGQIWNPSISPEWRPYSGKNPHTEHFHVSYNR